MKITGQWSEMFGIEPGEGRQVFLFLAFSFFLGMANNFAQTAAYTLFLTRFTAQTLSYVYILNAIVVTGLTAFYIRMGRKLSYQKLLSFNLGFFLVLVVLFWAGLLLLKADWVIFLLPVLFQALINFGIMAFWPLANRLFTVRQGKRLFGLIGSGQWIAIVITGFLMGPISRGIGTPNLLALSAVGILGAFAIQWKITRSYNSEVPSEPQNKSTPTGAKVTSESQTSLWRNRYVQLIFGLVAVWWVGFFLLDNLFYDRAAARYPDPAQLAGFLGFYLSGLGILTLFMNFVLAGRIVSRYGMRTSLLLLPTLLAVAALVLAITGTTGGSVILLFWMTIAAKLIDMTLGFSVDRSLQSLLYQPFPAIRRGQIQTIAEGAVQPFANGLAGVLLLGLGFLFKTGTLPLIFALFVVSILWVLTAYALGKEYPRKLLEAISKRRLDLSRINYADSSTILLLRQGLQASQPGPVIYAANSLEEVNRETLIQAIPELIKHSAPLVRQNTYERIERLQLDESLPQLRTALQIETHPEARKAGIRTLLSFGKEEDLAKGVTYLDHPISQVRSGALVGMIRAGGIEGVLIAGEKLLQLVHSSRIEDRILAAQAMGEIAIQQYYQPMLTLLKDPDPRVRQAGLKASGQIKSEHLWPLVINALGDPQVSGSAAVALAAGGGAVLPIIRSAFDRPDLPRAVHHHLAAVCGQIKTPEAIDLLRSKMEIPDMETRGQVLNALNHAGYSAQPPETARFITWIKKEAGFSTWLLAGRLDLAESEPCAIVLSALDGELARSQERIFSLLCCISNRQALWQARQSLNHPSPELRAYALEIIDTQLPQELKPLLIPLLDESTPEQRFKRLAAQFPQHVLNPEERLQEIISRPVEWNSAWLVATTLYAGGLVKITWQDQSADWVKEMNSVVIQDTLKWAQSRRNGHLYMNSGSNSGGANMLSIIEKVLILKKTSLFTETPDDALAEVAQVLEEVSFTAGQIIFEKGAPGSSMYLIASGKVRVFDGTRTLNYLEEGDVFGEMAVLDPEPRSASVEAVDETQLLRIDQVQLYELVESRLEVARGIIHVLSRHLRNRMRDLDRLQNVMERPLRA